jgi:hypothetical protein
MGFYFLFIFYFLGWKDMNVGDGEDGMYIILGKWLGKGKEIVQVLS